MNLKRFPEKIDKVCINLNANFVYLCKKESRERKMLIPSLYVFTFLNKNINRAYLFMALVPLLYVMI